MRRLSQSRSQRADLLVRPPCTNRDVERGWAALFVNTIDQLKELAALYTRGLLSSDEYDREKAKVIDA